MQQRAGQICLWTAALMSGLLLAQQPAPQASKKGAIEGAVLNIQSGAPLQGAYVTLMWHNPPKMEIYGGGPPPLQTLWSAETDARGRFSFPDLNAGNYNLSASMSGYSVLERVAYGARIPLSAGEIAANLKIELTPQMILRGWVFDEQVKPIPKVGVAALNEQYIDGRKQLGVISGAVTETNDLGQFQLATVWSGPLVLQFMPTRLLRATPNGIAIEETDMGYYTSYFPDSADASRATRIEFSPGAQRVTLSGTLHRAPVNRIRGVVRDHAGQPVKKCFLMLVPTGPAFVSPLMAQVANATDGSFEFPRVTPGSYRLVVQFEEPVRIHRQPLTMTARNIDNLEVRLPAPVQIEGEILLKDVKLNPRFLSISLQADEDGTRSLPLPRISADGSRFVFDDVLPGKYRVTASFSTLADESLYVEPLRYGERELTEAPIEITSRPSRLRVSIASGARSMSGVVMKGKDPGRRALVLLLHAEKSRRLDQRWPKNSWTNEKGQFTIEQIPPGDYLAFAFEQREEGFWRDEMRFAKFAARAKKVSIGRDAPTNVRLEVMALPE